MQKTDFNYEILIGEDCSTDNTRKIVENYVDLYPEKVKLITSEKNVGARKNLQRLFENSQGKYIAVCEGDDYWTDPNKLQQQVHYMEKHSDCSMCFHASEILQANKRKTGMIIRPYNEDKVSPIEDIIAGGGGFCPTGSLFYPKELLKDIPTFYREAHVGDYPLQLILSSKGYVYFMKRCMSVYRIGVEGSWTNRMFKKESIKENMINILQGDIVLLNEFNKFTNNKNVQVIEKNILIKEYEILLIRRKTEELNNIKFDTIKKIQRLKIYIRCYFPEIYKKVIWSKLCINRIVYSFYK